MTIIKRKKTSVSILILLALLSPQLFAESWVAVKGDPTLSDPNSLEIVSGSVLDFSGFNKSLHITNKLIINTSGRFANASNPNVSLKFLIASPNFGIQSGGIPSKPDIDREILQYKMHGYNMVRYHFLEYGLMYNRKADFDYNPEQLDRFYYFVSQLKKNGIYLILDGLSAPNGGYGDDNIYSYQDPSDPTKNVKAYYWDRYIDNKNLKFGVFFDPIAQQHWKDLIASMYGKVNPYTGLTTLQDPVLAGLILVNENNILNTGTGNNIPVMQKEFSKWLLNKYGSNSALSIAWGAELKADENIELGKINIPKFLDSPSKRMANIQQFNAEIEKKTGDWMTSYVAGLGFNGPVTSYHFLLNPASDISRGEFKWADMHMYGASEYYSSNGEYSISQDSMLGNRADYIGQIATAKHLGKPFTVTEHGQIAWNQYRREAALALPAYAAFQSWDGICQHSASISLSYSYDALKQPVPLVLPYSVGSDPISKTTDTLAALLYLRGDVSPAVNNIGAKVSKLDVFNLDSNASAIPQEVRSLSLVTGLGLDIDGATKTLVDSGKNLASYKAQLDIYKPGQLDLYTSNGVQRFNRYPTEWTNEGFTDLGIQNLRDAGLIGSSNITNAYSGIYQSDTGQITLTVPKKEMRVITNKTEATTFDVQSTTFSPINLQSLSILSADSSALVSISVMDTASTIASSKRMLIILSTDAVNTEMGFTDSTRTSLSNKAIDGKPDFGKLPVLVRVAKVKLALKKSNTKTLKVYSVDLRGQRKQLIPITSQTPSKIEFELDISKLTQGATTYFEIST